MKTVLVVDDEFDIAEALQTILEDEGFRVLTARDGAEGLEVMRRTPPDLALVDVMMPRLGGLELLREARADPALGRIPVVLMSALRPKARQEEAGWSAFLQKPFGMETLLRTVRKHLPA